MSTLAITGLSGVIGSHLLSALPGDLDIIDLFHVKKSEGRKNRYVRHVPLDLMNSDQIIRTLELLRPDAIVHCAGITHIDRCESEKYLGENGQVWKVNVESTRAISRYCESNNIYFLYVSTECVFDGKKGMYLESDPPNPINWYGHTKALGEESVLRSTQGAVFRSIVAFHSHDEGKTIYGAMKSKLQSGVPMQAVSDTFFSPTFTRDITEAISTLLAKQKTGVFHFCGLGEVTPFAFGQELASQIGISSSQVLPVSSMDFFGRERAKLRLEHASLDCSKTMDMLGLRQRTVQETFSIL